MKKLILILLAFLTLGCGPQEKHNPPKVYPQLPVIDLSTLPPTPNMPNLKLISKQTIKTDVEQFQLVKVYDTEDNNIIYIVVRNVGTTSITAVKK